MTDSGRLMREIEALRERISTLSAAVLRITSTLDLDTVLAEAVESARGLTGASRGAVVIVGDAGAPQDYVLSGLTEEQEREAAAWSGHARLYAHLRELPGPLRVADLPGYYRSLGIEPARAPYRTLLGTPMRHRGADVGSFFLAGKAGDEEFTDEDEEVLVLFAA